MCTYDAVNRLFLSVKESKQEYLCQTYTASADTQCRMSKVYFKFWERRILRTDGHTYQVDYKNAQ
jgi:hypothetical protein